MNATECNSLIASVEWTEPRKILLLAILIFIDILVIVGNTLVVAAVTSSHKLRSVTNFFIVSLAVADLLVGLAVLPFSATWEVFKVWIFGDVWCRVWLAVDVWMCTASILNLCAISLDRYVAVTRPVTYPSIMSTRRAKSLIAGLWVLSFVICFPPLVGWKEQKVKENLLLPYGNHTLVSMSPSPVTSTSSYSSSPSVSSISSSSSSPSTGTSSAFSTITSSSIAESWEVGGMGETSPNPPPCPWTCELTNDAGYVVYSALGSFYIPMFVMLFFYWRIYRAAERTTRAINQGFRTTKVQENPVTEVCLRCICDASSGCDPTVRCSGESCGMFRITWAYWADAGKPVLPGDAPESQTAYANCANDPQCAASTVQGYMRKFGQDCNGDGIIDCLDHAAIHKLGGYGCKNTVPVAYQTKVDQCIHYAAGTQI